jgi:hypothetical protein
MTLEQRLQERRDEILGIAAKHGAFNVRVFGSVARGEADEHSDLDFLVELQPGRSLLDLGGLQYDLEAALGCRVDAVSERVGVSPGRGLAGAWAPRPSGAVIRSRYLSGPHRFQPIAKRQFYQDATRHIVCRSERASLSISSIICIGSTRDLRVAWIG